MSERSWFVVERNAAGEFPGIYFDILPERLTRKGSTLIVYAMRIDRLPDPERWLAMPLDHLYRCYLFARDHGNLVHNLADEAKAASPAVRKLGEYWQPLAPTWDQSQPFIRPEVKPI